MKSREKMKPVINLPKNKISVLSAVLFFYFFISPALAAAPTVGTISPSGVTVPPGAKINFITTYSDVDGWTNLKEAYFLISINQSMLVNSVYLYYDQNTNKLYLRNESNTAWLGGYAPGSRNTITNVYARLDCLSTTVSGFGNTMTVRWSISFNQPYSGKTCNMYLKAVDDIGGIANWTQQGTCTINNPPFIGSIIPSSGASQAGAAQTFTTAFSDSDGWQNIQYVYFLMNTSASAFTNCSYLYYNQNTNLLYLRNDANTAWLGGYAPGSANTIENSYAKLNCALTSVTGAGTAMTINWSLILKTSFAGAKSTYLYVKDDANMFQGFIPRGTWTIPGLPPSAGTVTPSSGSVYPDQTVNFAATYTEPDTWLNIKYVNFLINNSTSGANCLYAYYDRGTNKLYLRNDVDTSWSGGYAPGSANTIENSYAKLDCSQTTVSGAGNTLTVNWAVAFKSAYAGIKNIYLFVCNVANMVSGWQQRGDFCLFRKGLIRPQ
jgi:hypothetical protein